MEKLVFADSRNPAPAVVERSVTALASGELVILATDTVYGLVANALDKASVDRLFEVKERPRDKPIPILISEPAAALSLSDVSTLTWKLMEQFWPGPITLILKLRSQPLIDVPVAPGGTIGVRCPASTLVHAIIDRLEAPLAATSANLSGQRSPTHHSELEATLVEKAGLVLQSGETEFRQDSTVLDVIASEPQLLRPGPVSRTQLEAFLEEYGGGIVLGTSDH